MPTLFESYPLRRGGRKRSRTPGREKSGYERVGRVGETLLQAFESEDESKITQALQSITEIAKQLDPHDQIAFLETIEPDKLSIDLSELGQAYEAYPARGQEKPKSKDFIARKKDLKEALKKVYTALVALDKDTIKTLAWETILKGLLIRKADGDYPGDLYHAPLYRVVGSTEPNTPDKGDLTLAFSQPDPDDAATEADSKIGMKNYLYFSPKQGGANKPGPLGALYLNCYQSADGAIHPQVIFCKQATDKGIPNHRENIAEVYGGRLMHDLAGDVISNTYISIAPEGKSGDPDAMYVSSVYLDDFQDLHEAAHEALKRKAPKRGKGPFGGQMISAPLFGNPGFKEGCNLLAEDNTIEQTSLGSIHAANILAGNHQFHGQNIGLSRFPGTPSIKYVGLDFGGTARRPHTFGSEVKKGRFERVIHAENWREKKKLAAYLRAYPSQVLTSESYITGFDKIARARVQDLEKSSDNNVDYLVSHYGEEGYLEHFAKELDTSATFKKVADVKMFLKDTMIGRQLSLEKYSLKLKLRNMRTSSPAYTEAGLIYDYPFYFLTNYKKLGRKGPLEIQDVLEDAANPNQALTKAFLDYITLPEWDLKNSPNLANVLEKILEKAKDSLNPAINEELVREVETLERFLALALRSKKAAVKPYDFKSRDDQKTLLQACDRAYRLIAEVYNKVPQEQQEVFLADLFDLTKKPAPIATYFTTEAAEETSGSESDLDQGPDPVIQDRIDKLLELQHSRYNDRAVFKEIAQTVEEKMEAWEKLSDPEEAEKDFHKSVLVIQNLINNANENEKIEAQALGNPEFPIETGDPAAKIEPSAGTKARKGPREHSRELTLTKKNGTSLSMYFNERITTRDRKPITDLVTLPDALSPAYFFAQTAQQYSHVLTFDNEADALAFFKGLIKTMKESHGAISLESLKAALRESFTQEPDEDILNDMTVTMLMDYKNNTEQFEAYKDSGRKMNTYDNPYFFPSDNYLFAAFNQIKANRELSGNKQSDITVTSAFDAHYAEALLLIHAMEKYGSDASKWDMDKVLEDMDKKNKSGWKLNNLKDKLENFGKTYETILSLAPQESPSLKRKHSGLFSTPKGSPKATSPSNSASPKNKSTRF